MMMRQTPMRAMMRPVTAVLMAGSLLAGCSSSSNVLSSTSSAVSDRFSQLFGGRSQQVSENLPQQRLAQDSQLECPTVAIRPGASTLAMAAPGLQPVGQDLQYQATLLQMARECAVAGNQVTAKVGIQGRIIVGPAGAPATVTVPIRIAVVEEGAQPKTILTKFYTTQVPMSGDSSTTFSFVAEDVVFPSPGAAIIENYVFYIGFAPEGMRGAPKQRALKGRQRQ